MPRYFARVSASYASKNKLGEFLSKNIDKYDRRILDSTPQLNQYISSLYKLVETANSNNPRCKPDQLIKWDMSFDSKTKGVNLIIYPGINRVFTINIQQEQESFLNRLKT